MREYLSKVNTAVYLCVNAKLNLSYTSCMPVDWTPASCHNQMPLDRERTLGRGGEW